MDPADTCPLQRARAIGPIPALSEGPCLPAAGQSELEVVEPGPAQSGRRYGIAFAVLLVVQVAIAVAVAGQSYFFADDFFYGSILTTEPLTLDLLLRSWFGHLVPGFIAADWLFYRAFGSNWAAAMVVVVAIQAAGTVVFVRLLEALRGRLVGNIAIAALVNLSLVLTTQSLWWGAMLTNVVPLVATVAALDGFVRWNRSRRLLPFLGMTLAFAIAVAFFEKSVVAAAYIGFLSLFVVDAGVPWRQRWRTTLGRWPAWLAIGVIAGVDLAVYVTGDYIAESVAPGNRQLLTFLFLSFSEGLVPSLFGFLPSSLSGVSGAVVLVLTNLIVLALVVLTSLRSSRAFQAWIFFALGYLLNQGALGRGRVQMLGEHMGELLRYQLDNVVLFGIALAVALPAITEPAGRRLSSSSLRRRLAGGGALLVVAGLLLPWTAGVRWEMEVSSGTATRGYVTILQASLAEQRRAEPELGFLAGDTVPGWVVYTQMAPYNRFDRVLPQLAPDVPFTNDSDRVLRASEQGEVYAAEFRPVAEVPVEGRCVGGGAEPSYTTWLSEPLAEGQWALRLAYAADEQGTVTVTVDNDVSGPGLRMAAEEHAVGPDSSLLVAVAGSLSVAKVTLASSGPGPVCLDSLEFGTFDD